MALKPFEFLDLERPIQVADIGAAAINESPVYLALLERSLAHLHAFEGDERQIEKIRSAFGDRASIYGDFLFDGHEQTVHIASGASGMTSLLKPRQAALDFFNGFAQFGHVSSTERVQTRKLDDLDNLPAIDFLKMDIQGAELTVLRHGATKLRDCLAIQLEVSWICLYEQQPTFGEIDTWMRSQGYVPHCFLDIKRWSIAPTVFKGNFRIPGNQLLESDIVYIRDPLQLDALTNEQLARFATLVHYCFGSSDLCAFILRELERRGFIEDGATSLYVIP